MLLLIIIIALLLLSLLLLLFLLLLLSSKIIKLESDNLCIDKYFRYLIIFNQLGQLQYL